jgi:hypothetical protein
VPYEPLVPWNIHKGEMAFLPQVKIGEAEFDGDASFLFFLKTVRIDSGQRFYKRTLAMIDMTRRSENKMAHNLPDACS